MARIESADAVTDLPPTSEVPERHRCVAARKLDEAEHPAIARLRDANVVGLRKCDRALGSIAGLFDSTLVRRDHCCGQLGVRLPPLATELRPECKRAGRVTGAQLPVPGAPFEDAEQPKHTGFPGVAPHIQGFALVLEEWPGSLELTRPDELVREDERRRAGQPPLRQRALEP